MKLMRGDKIHFQTSISRMEEQVVWESTVRLPRGLEALMKDIRLRGKE